MGAMFVVRIQRLLPLHLALGCGAGEVTPPPAIPPLESVPSVEAEAERRTVLTVVATNDIHGHLERLPDFGGYVRILRRLRERDGGILLIDAGDMWQGTIASNADEGKTGVAAFDALGYDAVTIGNHEFDYGPIGEEATPQSEDDNPFGALEARAREAGFPFLAANIRLAEGGEAPDWENVVPSVLVERAGVKVGMIGVTTEDTLTTTIAANVRTLAIAPLAETIAREARALRERGAQLIVVLAHAGGECAEDEPERCEGEIVEVVRALPRGLVDLVAAGHTHKRVLAEVQGVAVVETGALATGFGRVDFVFEEGELVDRIVHPIRDICAAPDRGLSDCEPGEYLEANVAPDPQVLAAVTPALERARAQIAEPLGETRASAVVGRGYREESALGNLLADLMRAVHPDVDVALLNAGGVRADLPEGPVTYGALYETFPFDNRFAFVELTGAQLKAIALRNLGHDGGILLGSGFTVKARCDDGELEVSLRDERGRPIPDRRTLTLLTSDYLATAGAFAAVGADAIRIEEGAPIREQLADHLRAEGPAIDPSAYFDAGAPRWELPAPRPISCP
jgi:2',3'-cyclic-nucleotide 2'-phosphodiesterase (5'-nucleotidase family)